MWTDEVEFVATVAQAVADAAAGSEGKGASCSAAAEYDRATIGGQHGVQGKGKGLTVSVGVAVSVPIGVATHTGAGRWVVGGGDADLFLSEKEGVAPVI